MAERLRDETSRMVAFIFDSPQEAQAFRAVVEHWPGPKQQARPG